MDPEYPKAKFIKEVLHRCVRLVLWGGSQVHLGGPAQMCQVSTVWGASQVHLGGPAQMC